MRKNVPLLLVLLLWPCLASADDWVCEDSITAGKYRRYVASAGQMPLLQVDEMCTAVSDNNTAAQRALVEPSSPTVIPAKYRKVSAQHLVIEMSAAEKQAVDDALAAEQAKQQAWHDETQTPGVCKYNTPQEIDTKVDQVKTNNQNDINAMTLVAADKSKLIAVSNRLVEGLRQVTKCDAARAGGGK